MPDIEGGIRLAHNGWRGRTIQGNDRPEIVPLSLGVSGLWRHFAVNEYRESLAGPSRPPAGELAVNAFVPILPAQ